MTVLNLLGRRLSKHQGYIEGNLPCRLMTFLGSIVGYCNSLTITGRVRTL